MIIKWLDDAIHDLQALRQYIAQDNPSAATKVAKRILNSVKLLSEQPGIGRPGRVHNTRELIIPQTPYIIPYRVKDGAIEVLRVLHSAMQWPDEIPAKISDVFLNYFGTENGMDLDIPNT